MIDAYELSKNHFQLKINKLVEEKRELIKKYNELIDCLNKSKSKINDLKTEQSTLNKKYNEIASIVDQLKKFRFIWTAITTLLVVINSLIGASLFIKLSICLYGLFFYYYNPIVLFGKGRLEVNHIFGYREANKNLDVLEKKYQKNNSNIRELEKNIELIHDSLDAFYDRIEKIKEETLGYEEKINWCNNLKKDNFKCKVRKNN